jgi:glutaredoxin-like protein
MALLSEQDRQTVRSHLAAITESVTLLFFSQTFGAPDTVLVAKQVLDEIVSLSDRIRLEEVNLILDKDRAAQYGISHIPSVVLLRNGEDTRLRFLGAPAGYEFMSLVEAVILAGTNDSGLTPASRAAIAVVTAPVDIKVFVTPSCPHCPRAVTLAHRMAVENSNIRATCVEATEFMDLAQQYRVTGVPKTIVEGTAVEILGAVDEDAFVGAITARFQPEPPEASNDGGTSGA